MVDVMAKTEHVISTGKKHKHILSEADMVEFLAMAWNQDIAFQTCYMVNFN